MIRFSLGLFFFVNKPNCVIASMNWIYCVKKMFIFCVDLSVDTTYALKEAKGISVLFVLHGIKTLTVSTWPKLWSDLIKRTHTVIDPITHIFNYICCFEFVEMVPFADDPVKINWNFTNMMFFLGINRETGNSDRIIWENN